MLRHQLIDLPAFYRSKITRTQIANHGSKGGTCRVISSTEFDLLLPPLKKRALLLLLGYCLLKEAVAM